MRVRTASSLVLDLLPYSRGGKGMLEKFLSAGMELKDVVRIVADLILAAGDTVRLILAIANLQTLQYFFLINYPERVDNAMGALLAS